MTCLAVDLNKYSLKGSLQVSSRWMQNALHQQTSTGVVRRRQWDFRCSTCENGYHQKKKKANRRDCREKSTLYWQEYKLIWPLKKLWRTPNGKNRGTGFLRAQRPLQPGKRMNYLQIFTSPSSLPNPNPESYPQSRPPPAASFTPSPDLPLLTIPHCFIQGPNSCRDSLGTHRPLWLGK